MTICYAIASGEYSDYQVLAIFTTKEKAEAELFKYGPEAVIETFPLDPVTPEWPTGFSLFRCFSDSSGLVSAYRNDLSSSGVDFQVQDVSQVLPQPGAKASTRYVTHVIAKDKRHAVKIAAEKFAKADAI